MTTLRLSVEPPDGRAFDRECTGAALVIGRSEAADIMLSDHLVSRQHARIFERDGRWMLEDLGARNGTSINGQRVDSPRPLSPGDVVELGATRVRVVAADAPGVSEAVHAAPLADGHLGSSIFRSAAALAQVNERSAERLKALNEFHRALAGPIALPQLLELMLEHLFAVLRPEEGVVLLRQPGGELKTAASRRLPGATGPLLVSRRLTEEVVGKGTAALVFDAALDERFAGAQSVVASGIRSIVAAPMTDAAGCVGMIALYSRAHVRRFAEADLQLLVSLASAAALRVRNIALAQDAAARRVMDHELALAHDIQMAMLPRERPDRPEIDVAAVLTPARAIGGDLYDFFVSGDTLWFIVADAAGKGVGAALFMAITRALFRALAAGGGGVAAVLTRMNAELAKDNDRQVFVTALAGRLDLRTGELTWCNAGHPPPLRVGAAGALEELDRGAGAIALGVLEEATYAEQRATLAAGDTVLLYTDGVTDAVAPDGSLFSAVRLTSTIAAAERGSAEAIVASIAQAVRAFAASVPQEDDITLLALRLCVGAEGQKGKAQSVTP